MGCVAAFVQAIFSGRFLKSLVAVINKKGIFLVTGKFFVPCITNINIQESITIHVCHYHARIPFIGLFDTRFFRNIFKLKIAFIQIQFIGSHVGSKENIGQTIVVNITNGNASAIIKITVIENVKFFSIYNFVIERNTRVFRFG